MSIVLALAPLFTAVAQLPPSHESSFDSVRLGALRWRPIGPYRGGRAVAAVGVPTQPLVYYAAFAGGGVWKSEDAGTNWRNVSDCCFRMGSVGAIAVAESDPNVIYVGMGEHAVRAQASSWGDGVYKSIDAGRTWTHLGLENTRQISRIIVHPTNANVVFVAAQGTRWAPSADRGIYRSVDGGKTWRLLLHPSDSAGASELSIDPSNPRVLYAAFWHGQRVPWQIRSGGTSGGIWKTTDGGETWTKLGGGLPTLMGKIGVAVSPGDSNRVYAIIEAENGGLWRSDDAGANWRLLSEDRRLLGRAWYYMKVVADPSNADVVYVLNFQILKSTNGGRTFAVLPATHPDNHQLWINSRNGSYLVNANDGGASVSIDGGRSWSTQDNQPTGQIYHVNVDAQRPYWIYGSQQDATTIAIASATREFGIGPKDWFRTAGGEGAHIAFDPQNPRYIYGSGNLATIGELDRQTQTRRNIMPWPALTLGEPSNELKYRFNWSAPVATSPHDRRTIYYAGNVLFKSTDRGTSWTIISSDLTRNDPSTQGFGGAPLNSESGGGEVYNTISAMMESPHNRGTIWVGTDDGLVHLTRDGGKTWANVTPPGLPVGQVNSIELSAYDRATAYIAFYRAKLNDNAPYVYRTEDGGRTWSRIVDGLPSGEPVRVVREGARKGLLFAGTETGVWVSFDNGRHWQSMQSNLPRVPVTDLVLERRSGDLVASTEGRAFWVFWGMHPMLQGIDTTTTTRLFRPADTHRQTYGGGGGVGADAQNLGRNPPPGAVIYYYIANPGDGTTAKLEILDSSGRVIRTFASTRGSAGTVDATISVMTSRAGLNSVVWDTRTEPLNRIPGPYFFSPTFGYRVAPGNYTARFMVAGKTFTQPLKLLPDPDFAVSANDMARQQHMLAQLHRRANEIFSLVRDLRALRDHVKRVSQQASTTTRADSILVHSKRLHARLDILEPIFIQPRTTNNQDVLNYRGGLIDQILFLRGSLDAADAGPTRAMELRLAELEDAWKQLDIQVREIIQRDVTALNALLDGTPLGVIPLRRPTR